jgi:hypothetical protein
MTESSGTREIGKSGNRGVGKDTQFVWVSCYMFYEALSRICVVF